MADQQSQSHGGKRPGCGRKPLDPDSPTVRITITLPRSMAAALRALGSGNLSRGVRILVKNALLERF